MELEENINAAIERVFSALETREAKANERFGDLDTRLRGLEQKDARAGLFRGGRQPRTWGEALTASDGFKALTASRRGTARTEVQAMITTADDSGGALIAPDTRTDPIMLVRRRPRVVDLITRASTGSNAVTIVRQATRTNNAAFVSEGATKPESAYAFEPDLVGVLTMAHWTAASVQALDDAPMLQGIIDGELRYGLEDKLDGEVLLGDGTSQHFEGLIPQATVFDPPYSAAAETALDVLLQARTQLELAHYPVTGWVMNPLDFAAMISLKDGDGRYLSGGPFAATSPQLWGAPVVTTTQMPAGDFLAGDFRRAATIFVRQEATVEVSNEHSDFFTRNLVAVRAEMRAALAVTDPNALIYGAFGNASSGA